MSKTSNILEPSLIESEFDSEPATQAMAIPGPNGSQLEHPTLLCPGRTVGPYCVTSLIGQGGMGVVYAANDPRLDRTVAIKTLAPKLAHDPLARGRFLREARLQAQIDHDNVLTVYQVDEVDGVPYFVMPLLQGETLQRRLSNKTPLSIEEVIRVGKQIAEGLVAAHAKELIHRDIKPGNIWLEAQSDRVKILDFGLARNTVQTNLEEHAEGHYFAGTSEYMSPEQASCSQISTKTDLFSLGILLYQCVTGVIPFQGEDRDSTVAALLNQKPIAPNERNRQLPESLNTLILQLLSKQPSDRPDSAETVVRTLGMIQSEKKPEQRIRFWGSLAALVMVGAILMFTKTLTAQVAPESSVAASLPALSDRVEKTPTQMEAAPFPRKVMPGDYDLAIRLLNYFGGVMLLNPEPLYTLYAEQCNDPNTLARIHWITMPRRVLPPDEIHEKVVPLLMELTELQTLELRQYWTFSPEDLQRLAKSNLGDTLQRLDLHTEPTPELIAALYPFKNLKEVGFVAGHAPREDWQRLHYQQGLCTVKLLGVGADVSENAGWRSVTELQDLISLELESFESLDSAFLSRLSHIPTLSGLFLKQCPIESDVYANLLDCRTVRFIKLNGRCYNDEHLDVLAKMGPRLSQIFINQASITDEGLARLKTCTTLQTLEVIHCDVSDAVMEELAKKLPNSRIIQDGKVYTPPSQRIDAR